MGMPPPFSRTSTLANQADHWLSLLRSGRATQHDYAAFRAWRDADPAHHQAWQHLAKGIDGAAFEHLSHPADADAPSMPAPVSRSRRRFLAGAGICAVGGAMVYVTNLVYPWRHMISDAATGISERRRYTLADGSKLLLDACSAVNLSYTPYLRQLTLQSGAVTVEETLEDPRPFLTVTEEGIIRSSGARYMVRQHPYRSLVVAHDAPVHIETRAGTRTVLEPGMGLRFDAVRVGEPSRDMASRAAWEHGRIVAHGITLSEIISSLRPYYPGMLRVTVSAGGLPVSGEYSLDDVQGTLRSLEKDLPITVKRFTPWITSISVAAS